MNDLKELIKEIKEHAERITEKVNHLCIFQGMLKWIWTYKEAYKQSKRLKNSSEW